MSLLESESAESSAVESILAMTPEELYELSDEERQKLWVAVNGNRDSQTLLRVRHDVDSLEARLGAMREYPLYSNLFDDDQEKALRYEAQVRSLFERWLQLFSQHKKYFSHRDIDPFETAFSQSLRLRNFYESSIDVASQILFRSFVWKDDQAFVSIAEEVLLGMVHSCVLDQNGDWPSLVFADYCLGKIDFATFQERLSIYINSKQENLDTMRKNLISSVLEVGRILRSRELYREEQGPYFSPYDGDPIDVILQEHNQLFHYRSILALDESSLNTRLAPLIYLYRGEEKA